MRSATTFGLAAAGVAAAIVAAPLPALADETEATGALTVTRFDDRYADGVFDPSKTTTGGDADRLNSSSPAQLVDVNGKRWYLSADADGKYRFAGVPVGPATLYLSHPNNPANEVFFDATGAQSSADIERLATREYFGPQGALDLVIGEGTGERVIGMTALGIVAEVAYADGSPVSGASISFGSGGEWFTGSEYAGLVGGYEALVGYTGVRHLPGDLGMKIAAPAGYRVASVTAATGSAPLSYPDIPLTVTERDGAYWVSSTDVPLYFFSAGFSVVLEQLPDTTRPETTLVSPASAGPLRALQIQVDASDDRGLQRIVANVYKGGKLVESTQSAIGGALAGTHAATVALPDGDYTIKYNAQDLAGNTSKTRTFDVSLDATAPVATVKNGTAFTRGDAAGYDLVSFKLSDAGKIDRIELNGKVKDLSDDKWSDVNFVKPGVFGAVQGVNTLVVFDVAGNARTIEFTLN
ncbi:Ig-like domain-containing protein [Microbacterium sp. HJ5]